MSEGLKRYHTLPVVVVEDHNEALPHIYRSIGSKYLPLSGITLLHFDSHPDMLIPVSMPADLVYSKHQLFESLSIENWILPAVYAGHISHVVWVKPPWCSQIQDQTTEFYVGKCKKTGTIRTTCCESYFMSETLYVPERQLENKQKLRFTSLTLCPNNWTDDQGENSSENSSEAGAHTVQWSAKSAQHGTVKNHQTSAINSVVKNVDKLNSERIVDSNQSRDKRKSSDKQESASAKKSKDDDGFSIDVNVNSVLESDTKSNFSSDDINKSERRKVFGNEQSFQSPTIEVLKSLETGLESGQYVLDIDLDFFSTMNPFKELYGESQYKILQELYHFTKPTGTSEKELLECVLAREKQLSTLKTALLTLKQDQDAEIQHKKASLIRSLVKDLWTSSAGSVDFDLLHEAGCTCDDTELPHHISSLTQISSLVDTMQEFLSYLKKPTYVTVARSSSDDYCPPSQVDSIQDSVLDLLQQLYLEISVTMDYQDGET